MVEGVIKYIIETVLMSHRRSSKLYPMRPEIKTYVADPCRFEILFMDSETISSTALDLGGCQNSLDRASPQVAPIAIEEASVSVGQYRSLVGSCLTRRLFGVDIADVSIRQAITLLDRCIDRVSNKAHAVFFVNTHAFNVSWGNQELHCALQSADCVFGDGTGVRWAVRALYGVRLRDNVNGTDLVQRMLSGLDGRSYRYFLLGNTPERIKRAADEAQRRFPDCELVGYHHGFFDEQDSSEVVDQINCSTADVLLVGMGNPRQEVWITSHLDRLNVPVCMGVGGLFDYWAGKIRRAPGWVRTLGYEWLSILIQQPHKASRYLLGNPLFLSRIVVRKWIQDGE